MAEARNYIMCVPVWKKKSHFLPGTIVSFCSMEDCGASVYLPGAHLENVNKGWKVICEDCTLQMNGIELQVSDKLLMQINEAYNQDASAEELTREVSTNMTRQLLERIKRKGN